MRSAVHSRALDPFRLRHFGTEKSCVFQGNQCSIPIPGSREPGAGSREPGAELTMQASTKKRFPDNLESYQ